MLTLCTAIVLFPLLGAFIAGLGGQRIGRAGAHQVTIASVAISFILSLPLLIMMTRDGAEAFNGVLYTWLTVAGIDFEIGFLVDGLTAVMVTTVTFVSLMVHIYTIGYMHDDDGYQRFFCYIALFTFAMLMLVMANNFLQLFFGWEGVGLVSYLLIGFWYKRPSATFAGLKAFLVNRVGDFGFLLGIAAVLLYFDSLDYRTVFSAAPNLADMTVQIIPGRDWSIFSVICILLFIGAMGKSAQVPLHVWLPDSMEGPTPISALIHAATMVTAGIFMVARMSPLFELSTTALSVVMVIGTLTALFMGLVAIVQNDIKRVVAYSTLSQLGYMTVALGVSAYGAGIFHLLTHAFFKALLFLGAGSVIIALHHQQDIRHMGGLRKFMPITWLTFLVGTLALVGTPGFSGFYSKDSIIEAVHASSLPGSGLVYLCLLAGVFVTAFYSFRLYFLVFHGSPRMTSSVQDHLQESPWVVTVPLILLAIPSAVLGYFTIEPLLLGNVFEGAIYVLPAHDTLGPLTEHFHAPWQFALEGLKTPAFWLVIAGLGAAWYLYLQRPGQADLLRQRFSGGYEILRQKYGFDDFYQVFFADGSRQFGQGLWKYGETALIDGLLVTGTSKLVGWFATLMRHVQSGFLYHYAFAMIIGLLGLLTWFVVR
jgi:NADH-quinone oxidoreductase subunit L